MNSNWSETGKESKRKEKEQIKKKIKSVQALDIQIKLSGLKVSNSKVFSLDSVSLIFKKAIYPFKVTV